MHLCARDAGVGDGPSERRPSERAAKAVERGVGVVRRAALRGDARIEGRMRRRKGADMVAVCGGVGCCVA